MLRNQKGFSAVEVLLVVIVIGLISGIGWYVRQQREDDTSKQAITNFQECAAAGNPVMESYPEQCHVDGQTFTNLNQQTSNPAFAEKLSTNIFEIRELGVKFELPNSLKGLYYVIGNEGKTAYFSLDELRSTDCAADRTSQYALSRYTEADFAIDEPSMARKPHAKRFGEYYFISAGGGASCSEDKGVQGRAGTMRQELSKILPSTVQLIE